MASPHGVGWSLLSVPVGSFLIEHSTMDYLCIQSVYIPEERSSTLCTIAAYYVMGPKMSALHALSQ